MLKKHEEYLRKSQHDCNFKRLFILIFNDFSSFLVLANLGRKYTNLISTAQELMKVKIRGRIIQINILYLNGSIDRIQEKKK